MFGIVRSTSERLLRETLAERERVVQLLVEEVQFWRAQYGQPTITVQRAAQGESPTPSFPDGTEIEAQQVPDVEEEQLAAMLQAGVISQADYAQSLERLQNRTPDDIIE